MFLLTLREDKRQKLLKERAIRIHTEQSLFLLIEFSSFHCLGEAAAEKKQLGGQNSRNDIIYESA